MPTWTPQQIEHATQGRWLAEPSRPIHDLTTDSRAIQPNQLFCALKGDRFDGHDYLAAAQQAGASGLIIDQPATADSLPPDPAIGILLVDNTLSALTNLAAWHRNQLTNTKVIAITGSVGKTTTKHLVHHILSRTLHGSASPKSFNNHIGVPLTILAAEPDHDYLIAEIGTNAPGEIETLGRIAQPDVAVITAVAAVHLQGLGSVEAILTEKTSLLNTLRPKGLAIVNADAPGLAAAARNTANHVTYGQAEEATLRLTQTDVTPSGLTFQFNSDTTFHAPIPGRHNIHNLLAAIAIARAMDLTDQQIAHALTTADLPPMRLNLRQFGPADQPITLINDAYNANPASMSAALATLTDTPTTGRRIAILGDMLELGDASIELHQQLGRDIAANHDINIAAFIGPHAATAAALSASQRLNKDHLIAADQYTDTLAERIAAIIQPGDTILLKASRGIALEQLVPQIEKRAEQLTYRKPTNTTAVTDDA